jgi:3',5'-nucleoside bisphosphate phosphatase
MRWYKADLHIHSVLSPCGGLEMSPLCVIKKAKELGLDIIAITDHNTMANCSAYHRVAEKEDVNFLNGVEIQTAEEIHLIALFDEFANAMSFDRELYDSLLNIPNDPEYFGDQVVVDADENIIRCEDKALLNSSLWSLDEVLIKVEEHNGFCFPAHVDATTFSIIGQLGFIPDSLPIAAVGITAKGKRDVILENYPFLQKFALIRSSDAHYLADIGSGYAMFLLESPTVKEIRMACKGLEGRRIWNEKDEININQEE